MDRRWWCRFSGEGFECCEVSDQESRSIQRCLFGAYFDHGVVRGFFRAREMSSGTGRIRSDHCGVFFSSLGVFERLGASERVLVILRERREDFLCPTAASESSGLDLLVGRWRDLRRRRATRGRGFEFGGGVIVCWLGARKGA